MLMLRAVSASILAAAGAMACRRIGDCTTGGEWSGSRDASASASGGGSGSGSDSQGPSGATVGRGVHGLTTGVTGSDRAGDIDE